MVGVNRVVRDIVIPIKGGSDPVFTIVCEILTTPGPTYPEGDEENEDSPHVTRLWKMASAWRVMSFFLVVFVLPTVLISLPLYARYHLYHARHLPMTETDTRALNHAVSSFWCQGQRVTSNGTLDAFKVAGSPRVQKQRRQVKLRRDLILQHDDIEYWGVYLLEGSKFSLSSCARWPGGTLLVVRGEDNLRKCFYREDRVKETLNGGPPPSVTNKGRPDLDNDDLDDIQLDVDDEEGGRGGEVYDDDDDDDGHQITKLKPEATTQEVIDKEDGDLVSLLEEDIKIHKLDMLAKKVKKNKKPKGERRKNRRGKKDKDGHKERHNRNRRSKLIERIRRDVASTFYPEESSHSSAAEKLKILHKFNDTLEVTAGNSSISSSEEFLEQCSDTLLTVDLSPYRDWQIRVLDVKSSNPDFWEFLVNTTDYYYFIFTSDNSIELNEIGFNLELERATYDVSSPLETCRNSTECVFPLTFAQTESVVVEVLAGENLHELHSFEVTTTCQPRVPVYMVFILLVPFIILLFAFQ